jgi:hypothetical protein
MQTSYASHQLLNCKLRSQELMERHVWLLEPGTTRKHSLMCERRTDRSGVATW